MQGLGHHTHAFQYPQQSHPQHPPMHDHLDPNQAAMYPYPPAQQPQAFMDPYYAPHQNLNQGMDGYLGMPMNPHPNGPQTGDPNQGGFSAPGQAVGGPRLYPQAPRPYVDVPRTMGGLHHGNPYQREQQRLQTMQRFNSHQLSHQQQYQHQRPQPHEQHHHQAQRQQSGPAPAGVHLSTLPFAGLTNHSCMQTLHAASGTCLCRRFVAWSPFTIPLTCTVFTQTACMLSSHSFEKFCTPLRALL